jgi:hypothetical protein
MTAPHCQTTRPSIPVLSSVDEKILDSFPYSGASEGMPGKCVLSPKMEILDCFTGHGEDEAAFDLIRAHHGEE